MEFIEDKKMWNINIETVRSKHQILVARNFYNKILVVFRICGSVCGSNCGSICGNEKFS